MMGDLQNLAENLLKWVVIAGAFGVTTPASTDTLSMFAPSAYVADFARNVHADVTMNASVGPQAGLGHGVSTWENVVSLEAQMAVYREACDEATAALRVVQSLGQQVGLPEVSDYVASLSAALSATPDKPTLEQTRSFAQWLRGARTQLLDKAGSFRTWLAVAELLDPGGGPHPVPQRFVKWESPSPEPVLRDVASKVRVRRALANLLGDDADSRSSRG